MEKRLRISAAILLSLATMVPAQQSAPRLLQSNSGNLGLSLEYWSAGDDKVNEFVVPLVVQYAAGQHLQFTLVNQPTMASLKRTIGNSKLSGLTDTRFGAAYWFADESLLATAGVSLPTGQTALDADELRVAQVIAMHSLGMRTNYFGGGLDVSAGLSAALPAGNWIIGTGFGYVRKGNFEPTADFGDYDPGDELSLTVGFDRGLGETSKLLFDATYTIYTTDVFQEADYFRSGERVLLEGRLYFPFKQFDVALIVRDRIKGKNAILQSDANTNVLKLRQESANSNSNELDLIAEGTRTISENSSLNAALQAKFYSANDAGALGATVFGLGGGWQTRLSSAMRLDLGATFSIGSLKDQGQSTSIYGIDLHGGIIYTF